MIWIHPNCSLNNNQEIQNIIWIRYLILSGNHSDYYIKLKSQNLSKTVGINSFH